MLLYVDVDLEKYNSPGKSCSDIKHATLPKQDIITQSDELIITIKELVFQSEEKSRRTAELDIAVKELAFQNTEKEQRAAELRIANKELAYQNEEKEKRAVELGIANKELAFQNEEKENRAAELIIANKELAFQNTEKENRASELIVANKELAFQNEEKGKRAAELEIANKELAYQNEEKEKRATELSIANKELMAFNYISSHDLQEPLRKIQTFSNKLLDKEYDTLTEQGKHYLDRIQNAAGRMQQLILDLLAYSRINATERIFEKADLSVIIAEIMVDLAEAIEEKHAVINIGELCRARVIPFQFRQLLYNLISNALKFSIPGHAAHVNITSEILTGNVTVNGLLLPKSKYCHIVVKDNGIGFEPEFSDRVFEVFKKLHNKEQYEGTGIGLAIVKKIVDNHNGVITATGEPGIGATFDIYLPE